ncbi:MAG TPA: hypothetical protein VHR47_07220, partial [Bacillota bacterium]|nr:hypothetical protein [Bacillota bacterium]
MKQKVRLLALLLLPLAITGCWDQKIIEKKAFITELGLEPTHGSELLLTIVAPQLNHQGDRNNELLTTQARLIGEGLKNAN